MSITRPLTSPLARSLPRSLSQPGRGGGGFSPASLFAASEPGWFYDTSDLTTLYEDSNGTTAATVNGLVGLQLDKSKGLVRGVEALSNTDFNSATGWTLYGSSTIGSGVLSINSGIAAPLAQIAPTTPVVVGEVYEVTIEVSSYTSGSLYLFGINTAAVPQISSAGTHTFLKQVNNAGAPFRISTLTGVVAEITRVSFKKVLGLHRYQSTTAQKPILRGTPTGAAVFADDFSDGDTAGWTGVGASLAVVSGEIRLTNTGADFGRAQASFATTASRVYRARFKVIPGTSGGGYFRLGTSAGATNIYDSGNVTSTQSREIYFTATSSTTHVSLWVGSNVSGQTSSFDNIEIHDASASAVAAPYFLQYDGVDDNLVTASADFTATDKVTLCAGVRNLATVGYSVFSELSVNFDTNSGVFTLGTTTAHLGGSRGTVSATAASAALVIGTSYVLSLTNSIGGDSVSLRRNGAAAASSAGDQGTGNYGNYPVYFGRRGGTSNPFTGYDYGSLGIGRLLTTPELGNTESFYADLTGVTLP